MKKLIFVGVALLLSVPTFAQSRWGNRDRVQRGHQCIIFTQASHQYEGYGRSCIEAQHDAIAECRYGQSRRGVINIDRCNHSIRPGKRYQMSCTYGCGYAPYLN